MNHPSHVLAVDAGTESARAAVFDADGNVVGMATEPYPTRFPKPGWAEQDPGDWWRAFVVAVRKAVAASGVHRDSILGLSVDATSCTVVLMDERHRVLRPPLLWMDVRATDQAKRIAATGHDALKYNGHGGVSAEWMPCKLLWVKENEPQVYRAARHFCEYVDWLTLKLTGRLTASVNTTTVRWYYSRPDGGWPRGFYDQIGIGDAVDRFPAEVLDIGVVVGGLRPEVANELGLKAGIPVAEGGTDGVIAMLGLNVVAPGHVALIGGSSHVLLACVPQPVHRRGVFGTYPDALVPGSHVLEGGQGSTGSVLNWFVRNFGAKAEAVANKRGVSAFDHLNEQAAQLSPGSNGLVVLEHWQGNRSPYADSESRGVIWGLSLSHEAPHIYRAIMEGIAYGTRNSLLNLAQVGCHARDITVCGGLAKSRLWLQIHADVCNLPILLTQVPDATVLGTAIIASVGAGLHPSIPVAAARMVKVVDKIEPNLDNHHAYKFYFDRYVQTYERMNDLLHEVVRHQSAGCYG
ncbi:MAG: xylulose kinase, partial [Planctomycetes bacterium]|nr:xylulose kinase [Planctomycetota bacterium]